MQKALEDGTLLVRPIFSATGTPTYNLAKFCDRLNLRHQPIIWLNFKTPKKQ